MRVRCVKMSTAAQLLVGGERISGESIRSQNGEGKSGKNEGSRDTRIHVLLWSVAACCTTIKVGSSRYNDEQVLFQYTTPHV